MVVFQKAFLLLFSHFIERSPERITTYGNMAARVGSTVLRCPLRNYRFVQTVNVLYFPKLYGKIIPCEVLYYTIKVKDFPKDCKNI